MGYSTNYRLFASDSDVLKALIENETLEYMEFRERGGQAYATLEGKWYEHEEDLRKASKMSKGVLFTLHREGERGEDLWRKYFLDGKMQAAYARIQYDEFDSAKLK